MVAEASATSTGPSDADAATCQFSSSLTRSKARTRARTRFTSGSSRQIALGRPITHPLAQPTGAARRAEHDALVVELGRDQLPAAVLLPHQHRGRNPHVVEVGRVDVV
ncbi:hypothetical protein [Saccharopolyspora dendranthemae]|uniref:hypothetical protein n=1 Tax=Saccharopolyspora dendranthemae TaxID=1181886 RepID=UPI003CCC86E7